MAEPSSARRGQPFCKRYPEVQQMHPWLLGMIPSKEGSVQCPRLSPNWKSWSELHDEMG